MPEPVIVEEVMQLQLPVFEWTGNQSVVNRVAENMYVGNIKMNFGKTFDGCKYYDSIVHLTTQMHYIGAMEKKNE